MKCLKCGEENRNNAGKCFKCGTSLLWTPDSDAEEFKLKIKVSKLAITSVCLAIIGLLLFISCSILDKRYNSLNPDFLEILAFLSLFISAAAVLFGIISFIIIEVSGGRVKGIIFSIGAVLIPIFAVIIIVLFIVPKASRNIAFRMTCGTNLSGLGKAMLIYANDYDDEFPRAGGRNATWGSSVNYTATNPVQAYGTQNGTSTSATISSSLYLLVKYVEVTPKTFICPQNESGGDIDVSEFVPSLGEDLIDLWDFGTQPWMHNSYAYHMPYGKFLLTTSNEPGMAVAADRNPWIPSIGWSVKNFNSFNPNSNPNYGNTPCHQGQGQNVLYLDTHVTFKDNPFCGINEDNIYTSNNGSDLRKGTPPKVDQDLNAVGPATRIDSFLVNDPTPPNY